jgi:hypothetical protein
MIDLGRPAGFFVFGIFANSINHQHHQQRPTTANVTFGVGQD